MSPVVTALISLHVVATLFWLLSSFILARAKGAGSARMFRWQMAAATLAVFSGGGLWSMFHRGLFGPPEMILAGGALVAIVAAGVHAGKVVVTSKGETEPLAPNDTPRNRSRNRRIEVRVTR